MAIREAPRFPLGICHNNSSGKRHACVKPTHKKGGGWIGWSRFFAGMKVVKIDILYVTCLEYIVCTVYSIFFAGIWSYTSLSITMSTIFGWFNITISPVPPKACTCAFYDKIPCKRMSCGSSLFHLNILLARYWTISTRVLIGTHIKKYVYTYIHQKNSDNVTHTGSFSPNQLAGL